jgi:hypothetical protein
MKGESVNNRILTVAVALALAAGVTAAAPAPGEVPADEGFQGRMVSLGHPAGRPGSDGFPIWERLAGLTASERANAMLDLDSESELARRIESLWNSGACDAALALLPELAPEDLCISWREPITAPGVEWNADVLVSNRDSVREMQLDVHGATGRLYCFLRYDGDGRQNFWSGNMSTDGGQTWNETITWWASYALNISGVVVDSHAYICFPQGTSRNIAYLIRLKLSDGSRDTFPGGLNYFRMGEVSGADSIDELVLASNELTSGDRIYCSYVTNNEALTTIGYSTTSFDSYPFPGVGSGVAGGIDLEWNGYPSANPLVFSYLLADDRVRVTGYDMTANLDPLYTGDQTALTNNTSLGCHMDTMIVVFDQRRSAEHQTRYLVKYGDTTLWYQGSIGDTTLGFSQSCDVTGRWGDGFAVAYWQEPQNPYGVMYRRRPYGGAWSAPEAIQDGNTYSGYLPSIQRVASDAYGIVFLRSGYGGRAYFDRNDWTGIAAEKKGRMQAARIAVPTVLNGVLRLPGDFPAVLHDATGRKVGELQPGDNPVSNLNSGIYFVRRAADKSGAKVVIGR